MDEYANKPDWAAHDCLPACIRPLQCGLIGAATPDGRLIQLTTRAFDSRPPVPLLALDYHLIWTPKNVALVQLGRLLLTTPAKSRAETSLAPIY